MLQKFLVAKLQTFLMAMLQKFLIAMLQRFLITMHPCGQLSTKDWLFAPQLPFQQRPQRPPNKVRK